MTKNNPPPSCVTPEGKFVYGIHKPSYPVKNLRPDTLISKLGTTVEGSPVTNYRNFPDSDLTVENADWIFEIPNPFHFRGTTFIDKEWADASANDPTRIQLPPRQELSLTNLLNDTSTSLSLIDKLPRPLLLALATTTTDPRDLQRLAELCCDFEKDNSEIPHGLRYERHPEKGIRACIHDHDLFEAVANNPSLPDHFKIIMVIRPGAQGGSEIIGEWAKDKNTHVYEYLRRNSYIAGGHYAANMSDNAIRYSISELSAKDMMALRHLYYQRTYIRLAGTLGINLAQGCTPYSRDELESLRLQIVTALNGSESPAPATLWGWNFGFDFASSGYRLHASHQQIHQQYAMVPPKVEAYSGNTKTSLGNLTSYSSGDLIDQVIQQYGLAHNRDFFEDYFTALYSNKRMDGREDLEKELVVWEDSSVVLFVPKAQTSQWELQLMTKKNSHGMYPGNIVETDVSYRESLDQGILLAQKVLAGRGAKMVTSIEYSKRIGYLGRYQQPLLYSFLPRLPQSPGAFSEAQLRFINGHYPEDFAAVCRQQLR